MTCGCPSAVGDGHDFSRLIDERVPSVDPAKPRLVLALDYRGHGQSTYDRNPNNYTIRVALADLSAVLAALEITPAIFVGTSFGGVLAMMLAVLPPIAVAGVILTTSSS